MKKLFLFLALIWTSTHCAGFKQGQIDFSITSPQGQGTMAMKVSPQGWRATINMTQAAMTISLDLLMKQDQPKVIYQINDAAKSYSVMNLDEVAPPPAKNQKGEELKVEMLGKEKVLGYQASHVLVTKGTQKMEIWTSKEIEVYHVMEKLLAANPQARSQLEAYKAMKKKGIEGFFLKTLMYQGKDKVEMTAVKIEEKKFPPSLFAIPEGYTKQAGIGSLMQQMGNPQNMDALKKMMQENMTPEQMEALKKMMEGALQPKK